MAAGRRTSLLATAIREDRWHLAALCLLLALAEALARLPHFDGLRAAPDAIEGVLDVLEGKEDEQSRLSKPPAEAGGMMPHASAWGDSRRSHDQG